MKGLQVMVGTFPVAAMQMGVIGVGPLVNDHNETRTSPGAFPNTRWSVVIKAGSDDPDDSLQALSQLCEMYWYPLYAYVRRDGHSAEDAEDLTQGFFAKLLSADHLQNVRESRGKLRSYLLTGMRNFIISESRKQNREKRGGGQTIESLDAELAESRYAKEPFTDESPQRVFDQRWALTILQRACDGLEQEYDKSGKGDLFRELSHTLSGKNALGDETYNEIAKRLEMSEGALRVAIHRLRKRFAGALSDEIAHTVSDEAELKEELGYLCSLFGS